MSVDLFGRSLKNKIKISKGPPGQGFSLTPSEDYDIKGKRLCNIGEAVETSDAINLNFLKIYVQNIKQDITLLDQEIKRIDEQVSLEKERMISLIKDIIWPLIQEVIQIRRHRKEPIEVMSKVARDVIDFLT